MPDAADPLFTILLPILRPPHYLPFAVETVQAQTVEAWELFIVCDGAPPETVHAAERMAADDPRIQLRAHPKGERHGEAHRHLALQEARGTYVAHICDDDLWFPDHLLEMQRLLEQVDFGRTVPGSIDANGNCWPGVTDYGRSRVRKAILADKTAPASGLTSTGYRMSAYRRLPDGWAPAPTDIATDVHMWRKFLRQPGLTFGTRAALTAITLGVPFRRDWTVERRVAEVRSFRDRILDPLAVRDLRAELWHPLINEAADWRDHKAGRRRQSLWRRLFSRSRDR